MSSLNILPASHSSQLSEAASTSPRPWWRSLVLALLLLLSVGLYILLSNVASPDDHALDLPFLQVWMLCFLPYFAACLLVFVTKPAQGVQGRWRWVELALLFLGAVLFRALLIPVPPGLSHDSWRYLWDARLILHGYSPYTTPPWSNIFHAFQDPLIYGNMRFRNVPTLYPPGAQFFYVISYLLAPSNLFFLKGMFLVFDIITCGVLALLLQRKGLDARRVVIYAWCPLPIVEFAIEGHVDAVTLMLMVLAILCSTSNRRGGRILTGFLIGLATLTKIYPIILLAVVLRRSWRDWTVLASCLATILLGYLPFLILGHGQIFGFFSSYASEQGGNAGAIQQSLYWLGTHLGLALKDIVVLQQVVAVLLLGGVSLGVWILRLRERLRMEMAILLLIGTAFSISTHVFPWYVTTLLPWITLSAGPLWTRHRLSGKHVAVAMLWYFSSICLVSYYFAAVNEWPIYYIIAYDVLLAGLGVAALIGIAQIYVRFWGRSKERPYSG